MRDSETNAATPPVELKGVSQAINRAREIVDRPETAGSNFREENAQGLPVLHTITQVNPEMAKEENDRNHRVLENLQRLENYVPNATKIERERARLRDRAAKTREAAELLGSEQEKVTEATQKVEEFEKNNLPQELIRGEILIPSIDPITNNPKTNFTEVETNYRDNVDQWLAVAREQQQIALEQIKEDAKSPELKAAEARAKEAEQEAAQLREQLRLANEAKETETRRADAAVEAVRILREQAVDGTLPEIKSAKERAEAAEARVRELENASATPLDEEPELEMENLEVAPVDTRNRLERIRDGVAGGITAWLRHLDPRDKDWLWRIGAGIGIGEAIWASSTFPGGRLIASGLNFLAAQGVGLSVEGLRRAEISHARGEYENNDLIQRILDINDRHKVASDRTKNFFAGLSAGMTVGSIGTAIYGAVEEFIVPHPAISTETPPAESAKTIIKEYIYPYGTKFDPSGNSIAPTIVGAAKEILNSVVTPEAFNPIITIPDGGNFWSAWHIDSSFASNWADLHNGTTHTDVIKDMVIKLARANGHELGLVHAGDQIKFSEILTPEQIELVKKAAAAKSYGEYTSAIKPAYHVLLGK